MARKKKSKSNSAVGMASPSSGSARHSVDISDAENGYIINVSGETGGKENRYYSKRFIAPDRAEAIRISSSALAGGGVSRNKSGKKKKSDKKKISFRKA